MKIIFGLISVIIGVLLRTIISKIIFLQPDEEIFGYIAYIFGKGPSIEYLITRGFHWLGFPLFLSIWLKIFGVSMFSARMFSVLCSALMIIFLYITLLKITKQVKYAFIGSIVLSVIPFSLRYGFMILTEPLVWVFLSLSILTLVYAFEKEKWYMFALSGFLAVSGAFIRRSALIMFFIIIPTLVWTNRDSFKKMGKETLSWAGGYLLPLILGLGSLFLYYGYDKLKEMNFTKVPHLTENLSVSVSGILTQESFIYAAQPISWKALTLVILTVVASGVLLTALFKNKWKVVYLGALLWPALAAVIFYDKLSDFTLARVMVLPIVVLFIETGMKRSFQFYIALSILIGSAVAFSTITLAGNLWNVVIYMSIGAIVLVYLEDKMDSKVISPFLLFGGILFLLLLMNREPGLKDLFLVLLPIAGMTYCIGVPLTRKPDNGMIFALFGFLIPIVFFSSFDPLMILTILFLSVIGAFLIYSIRSKKGWKLVSLLFPIGAVFFALQIPQNVPFWGIYLPILGTIIYMGSAFTGLPFIKKLDHIIPLTGAIIGFIIVYMDTSSIFYSAIALVLVGSFSTMMRQLDNLSIIWKKLVKERISILFIMMIFGYLLFYDYYLWREVYFTEFLFQAAILSGLLIWILRSKINIIRVEKTENNTIRRILKPIKIRRRISVLFMLFLMISIPISVQAFIQTDWFQEEPMDQRPYMRTMEEIGNWIQDNSGKNEKVLAWHSFALEANRETILEISNAKVYNGKEIIETMETEHVNIFVRCYYTTHGLWNQKIFQDYILYNFVIEKIIDGNECWIRY